MAKRLEFAWQLQLLDSVCLEQKNSKAESGGVGGRGAVIDYQCLSQRKKDEKWYPESQKCSAFVSPGPDFSVN